MKLIVTLGAAATAAVIVSCSQQNAEPYRFENETHLRNIKMLTHAGENAEAYFSFDEKQLIFQARDEGMDCDQIFVMNVDGTGRTMLSSGRGRTTCSYFLPDGEHFIYASTHGAGDECPPPPDFSRGYVWQLYDSFDIYSSTLDGQTQVRLTDTPGYDAEATVSPQGDKIVFTSTRDGDPEIYVMDLDGSNQTRLTSAKGYDGGPFFSPDGSKIVFRASRPETEDELRDYDDLVQHGLVRPGILEIYVMNADGSGMRQITDFGKASFAPYFHPDGQRIVFASNTGNENARIFDLYIINTDGTGLEKITHDNTFDSFPMFTRDGKHLVFASNRHNHQEGDTNIFIAEWID